jgi:hypothetical protein
MSRLEKIIYTKEQIENSLDFIDFIGKYTKITKKGHNYIGLCPFHSEKTPSFNVFSGNSFKCFGCGESGKGVVDFYIKKENKDFVSALTDLSNDNIIINRDIIPKSIITKKETTIDWVIKPYTKEGLKYWHPITKEYLLDNDIYQLKHLNINKKPLLLDINNLYYVYEYRNVDNQLTGDCKILTIGNNVEKHNKWKTTLPNDKIWGLHKYINNPPDKLLIAKSLKDSVVNQICGFPSIATQNECSKTLKKIIPLIQELLPNTELIINFGSDEQGLKETIKISTHFNIRYVHTPLHLLNKKINDPFGLVKEYGIDSWKQILNKL